MIKNKGDKKIIFALSALVIVGVIFFGIKYFKKNTNITGSLADKNKGSAKISLENKVLVQNEDGKISKVDVASGKLENATVIERKDFSQFAGLPKMGTEGSKETQQNLVIVSRDKSKAIVTVITYDLAAKPSEIDGSQPVLSNDEYTCEFATKECVTSNLLSQKYEGLDSELQKTFGDIWWAKWDSEKNILLAHLSSEGKGNTSPVYACNAETKKCEKTEGFDALKSGDKTAIAPTGMFSPSLAKFAMVLQNDKPNEETGKEWQLLLYSIDDLTKPLRSYDLSTIIDNDKSISYDSVYSLAWNEDENKIAIGTSRRIFMLDVESGSLSLIYISPTNEEGDFYWDSSKLFLSPDAKSILFVDETDFVDTTNSVNAEDVSQEDDVIYINALKKIDLGNGNAVSEILSDSGLSLEL